MKEKIFARQIRFEEIGEEGQKRLQNARVVVVGCGALGSHTLPLLLRAGVGTIRIVDRDFVGYENLASQHLFSVEDAEKSMPKAVVAARRMSDTGMPSEVEPVVADLNPSNVVSLLSGFDVVVDCNDNFEVRFLINDFCVKNGVPWVFAALGASYGWTFPIIPQKTPCLRCIIETPPAPGDVPTCRTIGLFGPSAAATAALQSATVIRIILSKDTVQSNLTALDIWFGTSSRVQILKKDDCPCCGKYKFPFLEGKGTNYASVLCAEEGVRILPSESLELSLPEFYEKLRKTMDVEFNGFLLKIRRDELTMFLFPDGRAMVMGTTNTSVARSFYASVLGV